MNIDKGIPIPIGSHNGSCKYSGDKMEVGDSIFVAAGSVKDSYRISLSGTLNKKHKPKKFTSRSVEGGTRIWRIE